MTTSLTVDGRSIDLRKTYHAYIRGSIGSKQYQDFFVYDGDRLIDIKKAEDIICTLFVSSVLATFGLIKGLHASVCGATTDMRESGWKLTTQFVLGAVVIWVPQHDTDHMPHHHIGFYIGDERAVSIDPVTNVPIEHDLYFRPRKNSFHVVRGVEQIFIHDSLA